MKNAEFYERWLMYCLDMHAKEDGSNGSHWYDRNIYFYNETPCLRYVALGRGRGVLLMKHSIGTTPIPTKFAKVLQKVNVPDIACFSIYPNDRLKDEQLHERQRFVMLSRMIHHMDVVVLGHSDEAAAEHTHVNRNVNRMKDWCHDYTEYRDAFNLPWPDAPTHYIDRVRDLYAAKARRWQDPKAVEKRERARAKREAVKALGLE